MHRRDTEWPHRRVCGPHSFMALKALDGRAGVRRPPPRAGAGREGAGHVSFGSAMSRSRLSVSGCEVFPPQCDFSLEASLSPSEALFCQEAATRGWQRNSNSRLGFLLTLLPTGLTSEFPAFHPKVHRHRNHSPHTRVTDRLQSDT